MPLFRSFLISAILVVAACQSTPPPKQKSAAVKPAPVVVKAEVQVAALPVKKKVTPAPAVKAKPDLPPPSPDILEGKTLHEVTSLMGSPSLLRKDPPAEVWQYMTKDCVLHLFFYPGLNDALVVKHIAVNARNLSETVDRNRCFEGQLIEAGTLEKLRPSS